MPRVDAVAVDRGLAADCVEPGAVQQGGQQRMAVERQMDGIAAARARGVYTGC